ncbi:MAG: ABC-type nitrate/sulfonate/bicarbonate transport system, ATP binding component (ATPase) [Candidatus Magnetoglobus multicellularis str. Araruama]|uniref:ABC-type nitrate/sulfonate/bicarbonate transport system, ATP binding component (ATPase) n=1 Tax=Candidatus Magnetoglobus multicellularis str. Araruama TaxID=890399 RepID=A0A1V1P2K9_9BACT|nr:MAG: ABC-type nitrate/sulfonate/bicarbonate transport system, ATP binding component (ATPase) [Candidatus Magnetoglobus multicellularis str. Araruama]
MIKIQCNNVSYAYNSDQLIFNNISFNYHGPGFHALFGESGVGKSTLARIMAGMIVPDDGTIICQSEDTNVIYTTNQERFPGWQTIETHFKAFLPGHSHNLWRQMMSDFGVEQCLHARFEQLSLGQKNRVNLIRYLFQDDAILIMDESLANVDESMREKIILLIKQQFSSKCFIYISHHVREVCKYCDQIMVLRPPHKTPQVYHLSGQNYIFEKSLDSNTLKQNMLEIVHAT